VALLQAAVNQSIALLFRAWTTPRLPFTAFCGTSGAIQLMLLIRAAHLGDTNYTVRFHHTACALLHSVFSISTVDVGRGLVPRVRAATNNSATRWTSLRRQVRARRVQFCIHARRVVQRCCNGDVSCACTRITHVVHRRRVTPAVVYVFVLFLGLLPRVFVMLLHMLPACCSACLPHSGCRSCHYWTLYRLPRPFNCGAGWRGHLLALRYYSSPLLL